MRYFILFIALLSCYSAFCQKANKLINEGNKAYRLQEYDKAGNAYNKVLQADPGNTTAAFNLGNTLFKNKKYEDAEKVFDETVKKTDDRKLQSQLLYNKGVALTQQKKLEESINAYKQSLRINPADTLARENLQRALNEIKKQQQQQQQNQQQQKKDQKENQPKPKQNKLNNQQVQQLLKALEEQERKIQEKTMKKSPVPGQPDKDW